MNPHSTHPSQDQDGKDSAFTASTAELFKPLPTIESTKLVQCIGYVSTKKQVEYTFPMH